MGQRYWVIGGDYADCQFKHLKPGTEKISGPFKDRLRARMEWQRLTFRDRCGATERYSICVEPVLL
jgi:predicted ATPase with chaperone activity